MSEIILIIGLSFIGYNIMWLLWMWYWWKRSPPEWQRTIFAPLTVPLYIVLRVLDVIAGRAIASKSETRPPSLSSPEAPK